MRGTNSVTGQWLSGFDHFKQSLRDILATRRGSRVMRPDYGSRLPDLVDAPMNAETIAQVVYEASVAIVLWLDSVFQLKRVICQSVSAGRITLSVQGLYTPEGKQIILDGIEVVA